MKTPYELAQSRREHRQQSKMFEAFKPKPQPNILQGLTTLFSELWSLVSNKVFTVRLQDEIKVTNQVHIPEIKVPKAEVEVKIPDVKVNIPDIKIPQQEVIVKIPRSSIDVNIPDVIVPEIKIPQIKVPETKVTIVIPEKKLPTKFKKEYDERGTIIKMTEVYENGEVIATRKNNDWTIDDRRHT